MQDEIVRNDFARLLDGHGREAFQHRAVQFQRVERISLAPSQPQVALIARDRVKGIEHHMHDQWA